jgi:exodeoxyribonuclease VII large subunit
VERAGDQLAGLALRLAPALGRLAGEAGRRAVEGRGRLAALSARLDAAPGQRLAALAARLEALDRTRASLGHAETLARGFAIVRGDGRVVTSRAAAERATTLEIEFADGRLTPAPPRPLRKGRGGAGDQGSLF